MKFDEKYNYMNNFINYDVIWNIGIGFGFLSTDSNVFYNLITIIIGIVITILFYISVNCNFPNVLFSTEKT